MKLAPMTQEIWDQYAALGGMGTVPKEGIFVADEGKLVAGVCLHMTDVAMFCLGLRVSPDVPQETAERGLRLLTNAAKGRATIACRVAVFDLGADGVAVAQALGGHGLRLHQTIMAVFDPTSPALLPLRQEQPRPEADTESNGDPAAHGGVIDWKGVELEIPPPEESRKKRRAKSTASKRSPKRASSGTQP